MPVIPPQQLVALQSTPQNIRNICILAHVDHGKTSLSDGLLSSNGIISPKLAGQVRYLDSREDEQLRGITMQSSAISLFFRTLKAPPPETPDAPPTATDHLINLIDSPGHIDFSSEVSTASRLCDGALVLVDVVEGVCSQTITVLRQAWLEKIRPVLVLNKLDRLFTELRLSSAEAAAHLNKVVEQVNAVMGSFFAGERMEEDLKWREEKERRKAAGELTEEEFEEKDDEDIYFEPSKGNVIFASAIDGWAFRLSQFAQLYAPKLGVKPENLQKVLWGDYYLDPKTKRVLQARHLKGRNLKPMFVQFVMDNVHAVYQNTVVERDTEMVEKIVKALGVKILPRDLRAKDARITLTSIMSQWLPLSTSVLLAVIQELPSPLAAQSARIQSMLEEAPGAEAIDQEVKQSMLACNANGPVMAYVSKMVAVPEDELPRNKRRQLTADEMREQGRLQREQRERQVREARERAERAEAEANGVPLEEAMQKVSLTDAPTEAQVAEGEDAVEMSEEEEFMDENKEHMVGFSRIYSGTVSVGDELLVMGPKYNPAQPDRHVSRVTITDLYLLMGRELVALDKVPAGNVFGVGGLEGKVLKNGTICSVQGGGVNLAGVNLGSAPIVRVALEPADPRDMPKLVDGLKLLNQADPCVEVLVQDTGEHVILTAGELHLERCLKDLRERFAKVEIYSSKPIVPFKETIVKAPEMAPLKEGVEKRGEAVTTISSEKVGVKIRTRPLPAAVTEYLVKNAASFQRMFKHEQQQVSVGETTTALDGDIVEDEETLQTEKYLSKEELKAGLEEAFADKENDDKFEWKGIVDKIVAFGPKRIGPNLLVDSTSENWMRKAFHGDSEEDRARQSGALTARDFEDYLYTGFQIATLRGPLCHEPVQGIVCYVEDVTVQDEVDENGKSVLRSQMGQISGQFMTVVRDAIRQGFLQWSPRLLLAMYSVDIQASTDVLGKVYGVVARRRGRIVAEEMKEGTPFFSVKAVFPVVESFGFSDDIRKKTSGAASPQLIFNGFEMLDIDPFWVPTTEEELEDLGELAERENVAKNYMDAVRRRKGLFVERRLVKGAEKQRTLKR
ncbi:Cytoplasmic GTPase/eEF2-like protein (ribosomal bioproteinsis) [Saitoella coloradoensis]